MRKDSKEQISVSDLEGFLRVMKEKKDDVEIRKDSDSVIIEKGLKQFQMQKDGTVECEMPLHSFHTHSADSLEIRKDGIKVYYEDGDYIFEI